MILRWLINRRCGNPRCGEYYAGRIPLCWSCRLAWGRGAAWGSVIAFVLSLLVRLLG